MLTLVAPSRGAGSDGGKGPCPAPPPPPPQEITGKRKKKTIQKEFFRIFSLIPPTIILFYPLPPLICVSVRWKFRLFWCIRSAPFSGAERTSQNSISQRVYGKSGQSVPVTVAV
ncbi:MAG: hypothetical protein ACK4G3_06485, partial [bacterium]